MSKTVTEEINYAEHVLTPNKDVLVPIGIYDLFVKQNQFIIDKAKSEFGLKFSYYSKKDHKKLSQTKKANMKPEKLLSDYYENLDLESTEKNRNVSVDAEGLFALKLKGELGGVFRHNVDKGNSVLRSSLENKAAPESPKAISDES